MWSTSAVNCNDDRGSPTEGSVAVIAVQASATAMPLPTHPGYTYVTPCCGRPMAACHVGIVELVVGVVVEVVVVVVDVVVGGGRVVVVGGTVVVVGGSVVGGAVVSGGT